MRCRRVCLRVFSEENPVTGSQSRNQQVSQPSLAGLLSATMAESSLQDVLERADTPVLDLQGARSVRQLVVAALAARQGADRPVLAGSATGGESQELAGARTGVPGAYAVA